MAGDARQHRGLNRRSIRAYWVSIKISFWSALLGCADRLRHGRGRGHGRRVAQGDPLAAADLFGRRVELRRRAAGLRLHRHLGPAGLITVWLRTEFGINLRAWGSTCCPLGA
jgi:putative spermidine/putrescine transport system permease protein